MVHGILIRGTTPTQIFTLPDELSMKDISNASITYKQKGRTILVKRLEDCHFLAERHYTVSQSGDIQQTLYAAGEATTHPGVAGGAVSFRTAKSLANTGIPATLDRSVCSITGTFSPSSGIGAEAQLVLEGMRNITYSGSFGPYATSTKFSTGFKGIISARLVFCKVDGITNAAKLSYSDAGDIKVEFAGLEYANVRHTCDLEIEVVFKNDTYSCYMEARLLEDVSRTTYTGKWSYSYEHTEGGSPDLDLDNDKDIAVVLSQQETLLFDPYYKTTEVEFKIATVGSDVIPIASYRLRVEEGDDTILDLS